jgi:glycosyltransferase involved in cell wall biosynthesis
MTETSRGCVLFATMEFYPTNVGGAGTFIHHAASLLLERGYTVVLLFDAWRSEYEQLVNVDRLAIPYAHRLLVYWVEDLCQDLVIPVSCADMAIGKSLRLDHALRKLTQMHDVDLVEIYDFCGHGFHYLAQPPEERPPVAIRLHSTVELMERMTRAPLVPGRLWLFAMERAQLTLADMVLAPGAAFYEQVVRPLYPAMTPERVVVSPLPHVPIGELDYDPDARNVAFYGRLSTMKGLDTFLRAGVLALEDPVFARWLGRFVVIGPEDYVATALSPSEVRGLIPKDKIDRFRFTGRLDHAALLEQLQTVSFACFGNRLESFCYAAHELHTAGIPLIVNRIPAFEDGFEEDVSAVFFDGTAFDLAERMKRLARDGALRLELSQHGKARAASYWVDHYTDHLSQLRRQRAIAGNAASLGGSVIILSTGDRDAVERTESSLSSLSLQSFVLERDAAGELSFAGTRWRGTAGPGGPATPAGFQMVGETCLFVRAGDVVEPQWVRQALRVLAQNPRVGAVGGWVRTPAGIESMPYLYIPELAQPAEPGLRVLLRVGAGQTLAEYLYGWSSQSEQSYLLAHRAAGRVTVELPRLAVDTRHAVDLPATPVGAATVDFDRFSREFLTLTQQSATGKAGSGATFGLSDSDPDVLATMLTPSLVVLRKAKRSPGELWVVRLVGDDPLLELDWSAVMRGGDWVKTGGPETPAGMQMTRAGSMRFHTRGRSGVDLLLGPFCGTCEIVHRGRIHALDLDQADKEIRRVWLDQLDGAPPSRGPAYPPVSVAVLKPEHAALKTRDIDLVAIAPPADSSIAGMLRFRSGCCVLTPEELGLLAKSGPTRGIAYARQAIGNAGCHTVAIDAAVPGGSELAERLLCVNDEARIIALLGETTLLGIDGAVGAYRDLGPWLRLASRFPTRLTAASRSQGLIGVFSRCGAPGFKIPARLPPRRAVEHGEGAGIDVVIVAGTGTVQSAERDPRIAWLKANTAHMIMAAAHARRTGLGITRLWLPADDELGARIAQNFAAAPEIERYEDLDEAFCGDAQLRVALCVFPDDDELPEAAAIALSWGALPILGPAGVFSRCARLREALCVTYWEDAVAIAWALTRTAEGYDGLMEDYDRFRLEQEATIEATLAALLAGSLRHAEPDLVFGNP